MAVERFLPSAIAHFEPADLIGALNDLRKSGAGARLESAGRTTLAPELWAKLSAMLEPENLTRRIYAFDSFAGFPSVHEKDATTVADVVPGGLYADSHDELRALITEYDRDRFLGHIDKVHLIKGDVVETIPPFLEKHPHLVVSLLFLDMDLYEPTRVALERFVPRMPKGALLVFDELDNPMWPGETVAALEAVGLGRLALRRFEWDPYISYAVLD